MPATAYENKAHFPLPLVPVSRYTNPALFTLEIVLLLEPLSSCISAANSMLLFLFVLNLFSWSQILILLQNVFPTELVFLFLCYVDPLWNTGWCSSTFPEFSTLCFIFNPCRSPTVSLQSDRLSLHAGTVALPCDISQLEHSWTSACISLLG